MTVVSAKNISKAYGIDTILEDISFNINERDRVGLIGFNGAGKTTLLNIIAGNLKADDGAVNFAAGLRTGYLRQNGNFESEKTIYEEFLSFYTDIIAMEERLKEVMDEISARASEGKSTDKLMDEYSSLTDEFEKANGYGYKSELRGTLTALGFGEDDYNKTIATLSGGEKTRLSLGALMIQKPELLLLDEPTNHLDIDTLKWLEGQLRAYPGTVILISHDRYFLDRTINRIFEISNCRLTEYSCNYTEYITRKKENEAAAMKLYEANRKEIEKQEEMIRRFKQHGTEKLANRAKSREKMLDRIEHMDRPVQSFDTMKLNFRTALQSGKDVLRGEDLAMSYGDRVLFKNAGFDIKKDEKICLIGPNGVGKTTLLKIILGEEEADCGNLKLGTNVSIGYYDQEQSLLSPNKTVLEELHSSYRLYDQKELRNILGAFLFRGDDVFKPVSALSGGEKARLSLLKIMMQGANFLILDEPTNHLDIPSKEVFEDALLDFPGTLLMVSHDRYFLNKIPSRILELDTEGITEYLGKYDYYEEKKAQQSMTPEEQQKQLEPAITKTQLKEQKKKEKAAEEEKRRKKREHKKLEEEIMELEIKIGELHEYMCREEVFSDKDKMLEADYQLKKQEARLEELYELWTLDEE